VDARRAQFGIRPWRERLQYEMRAMTVIEIPRRLEPVTRDTFVTSAEERKTAERGTNRKIDAERAALK
jgi:hypothetical protein